MSKAILKAVLFIALFIHFATPQMNIKEAYTKRLHDTKQEESIKVEELTIYITNAKDKTFIVEKDIEPL